MGKESTHLRAYCVGTQEIVDRKHYCPPSPCSLPPPIPKFRPPTILHPWVLHCYSNALHTPDKLSTRHVSPFSAHKPFSNCAGDEAPPQSTTNSAHSDLGPACPNLSTFPQFPPCYEPWNLVPQMYHKGGNQVFFPQAWPTGEL